jgi:hypothetical protein
LVREPHRQQQRKSCPDQEPGIDAVSRGQDSAENLRTPNLEAGRHRRCCARNRHESFTIKDDPTGKEPSTADLFICNYMNAWKLEGGIWKMIGRHVGFMMRVRAAAKS